MQLRDNIIVEKKKKEKWTPLWYKNIFYSLE